MGEHLTGEHALLGERMGGIERRLDDFKDVVKELKDWLVSQGKTDASLEGRVIIVEQEKPKVEELRRELNDVKEEFTEMKATLKVVGRILWVVTGFAIAAFGAAIIELIILLNNVVSQS